MDAEKIVKEVPMGTLSHAGDQEDPTGTGKTSGLKETVPKLPGDQKILVGRPHAHDTGTTILADAGDHVLLVSRPEGTTGRGSPPSRQKSPPINNLNA